MAPCTTPIFKLTKEQANCFLKDVLQITEPIIRLQENKLLLLNKIIRQMYARIPFTNIRKGGISEYFVMPTFEEIKEVMFSRRGGTCINFTIFTFGLLTALDYDCYICDGGHAGGKSNHSAIVVCHLISPGSKHLVDTGAGVPLFQAVPLDFDKVSPEYHDDYMTYRFVKSTEGVIVCEKILSKDHYWDFVVDKKRKAALVGEWYGFMSYEVDTPRDVDFIMETRKKMFSIENAPMYMMVTILLIGFPKGRLCSVTNKALFCSSEEGAITYTKLEGQDAIKCSLEHYPQFPEELLQTSLTLSQSMEQRIRSQGRV